MSYMAIHQESKLKINVLMDTGATLNDSPHGFCSKALVIPHVPMLLSVRGLSLLQQVIFGYVQEGGYENFDEVVADFENVCWKSSRYVEALADNDMISHGFDADSIKFEACMFGWSDKEQRMKYCTYCTLDDLGVIELNHFFIHMPLFMSYDDIPAKTKKLKDPINDMVAIAKLNHARGESVGFVEKRHADGMPLGECRIGGGLTFFEITRNKVTAQKLKTTFSDYSEFLIPK